MEGYGRAQVCGFGSRPSFSFGVKAMATKTGSRKNGGIKLLTRVEELKLLSKAEKAGVLSAVEKAGLSLSTIERLGLLSKAEELGVLSAATDPATPGSLLTLSLALLLAAPAFVYLVPDDSVFQVALQALVALACLLAGPAAFAASTLVSNLQASN